MTVQLRAVEEVDLDAFFQHQLDPEAIRMAAFTVEDPTDRAAFLTRWGKILGNESIVARTILVDTSVVGHVASFVQDGDVEVTYWIDRAVWGRGIASQALAKFLTEVTIRPLHARVVKDNIGSRRVLEQCGFTVVGEDSGFAYGRGQDVEEFLLRLAA